MNHVVLMITANCDGPDGDAALSVVTSSSLDPADYEIAAALALRSCMNCGAQLRNILQLVQDVELKDPRSVPEPMVIG